MKRFVKMPVVKKKSSKKPVKKEPLAPVLSVEEELLLLRTTVEALSVSLEDKTKYSHSLLSAEVEAKARMEQLELELSEFVSAFSCLYSL